VRPRAIFTLPLILAAACAKDVVLPSAENADTCGDGFVESNEDCDNKSPGCTECKVTPGWQCVQNTCFYPCGDGVEGTGPNCDNAKKTSACDMNGWWVARENDAVRDAVLNQPQPASTWYLYRLSQSGSTFQVEEAIHCGFIVTGSATVQCTPGSLKALLYRNDPSAKGSHVRKGSFTAENGACTFSFDRFYRVRGGTEALLPSDFSQSLPLSSLAPLPYEADPLNPDLQHLDGAEDTDGDGHAGAAFQITGLATGVREATQRDYKEYGVQTTEVVPANAIQLTAHGDWDLQESVLSVNSCGETCSLITTPGHVDNATLVPRITMRYLGTSADSPRVKAVLVAPLGENLASDLATCANVRLALPHDPTL
jgi:hypothetical protein